MDRRGDEIERAVDRLLGEQERAPAGEGWAFFIYARGGMPLFVEIAEEGVEQTDASFSLPISVGLTGLIDELQSRFPDVADVEVYVHEGAPISQEDVVEELRAAGYAVRVIYPEI